MSPCAVTTAWNRREALSKCCNWSHRVFKNNSAVIHISFNIVEQSRKVCKQQTVQEDWGMTEDRCVYLESRVTPVVCCCGSFILSQAPSWSNGFTTASSWARPSRIRKASTATLNTQERETQMSYQRSIKSWAASMSAWAVTLKFTIRPKTS